MRSIGDFFLTGHADMKGFGPEVKAKAEESLSRSNLPAVGESHGRSFGSKLVLGVGSILATIGVGALARSGEAMADSLGRGLARLTAIDEATAKLRGLGFSADTVATVMSNALASVKGTAFGLDEAATVAATAIAAGIKPGQDLQRTLGLVGDTATIAGTSLGDMGAIFNKVAASNRLSMEEVNQLSDRGVPIIAMLAKQYGITAEAALKMVSQGKVHFADFQKVIQDNLGGAALKSGETFQGAFANMGAAISRFGASLLGGVFPIAKQVFGGLTGFLDSITEKAKPFGESIGRGMGAVITVIRDDLLPILRVAIGEIKTGFTDGATQSSGAMVRLGASIHDAIGYIKTLWEGLKAAVGAFRDGKTSGEGFVFIMSTFGIAVREVSAIIGGLVGFFDRNRVAAEALLAVIGFLTIAYKIGLAVQTVAAAGGMAKYLLSTNLVTTATTIWTGVQWLLNASFYGFPLVWIIAAIIALIAGIVLAIKYHKEIADFIVKVWNIVWRFFAEILGNIRDFFVNTWNTVYGNTVGALTKTRDFFVNTWNTVYGNTMDVFHSIRDFIVGVLDAIGERLMHALAPAITVFSAIWDVAWTFIKLGLQVAWALIQIVFVSIKFWVGVLTEAWQGFANFWSTIWTIVKAVLSAAWQNIQDKISTGLAIVRAIWDVAWQAVSDKVTYFWNVAKAIFEICHDYLVTRITSWIAFLRAKWDEVWQAIYNKLNIMWLGVKVIFEAIKSWIEVHLGPTFTRVQEVIANVWQQVKDKTSAMWNFLRGIFDGLKDGVVNGLVNAFHTCVDGIGRFWDSLKAKVREPIQAVINFINVGLIGGLNWVTDKLGIKNAHIDQIHPAGFAAGGRIPGAPSDKDNQLIWAASGEHVMPTARTRKWLPVLENIRLHDELPVGYEDGGVIGGLKNLGSNLLSFFTDPGKLFADLANKVVDQIPGGGSLRDLLIGAGHKMVSWAGDFIKEKLKSIVSLGGGGPTGAGPGFLPWPSSPMAQRGDSGVWHNIVDLIRSTGPLSGSFGNAYRPGDPLWHGSGRAVDWMGFNQDALANFFMARRGSVLELIHRSNSHDYAVTRGVNKGSFNQSLMEEHRNHVHVAMAKGGLVFDQGGAWPSGSYGVNTSGQTEQVTTGSTMDEVVGLLAQLISAVQGVAPGVGQEINHSGRSIVQLARST